MVSNRVDLQIVFHHTHLVVVVSRMPIVIVIKVFVPSVGIDFLIIDRILRCRLKAILSRLCSVCLCGFITILSTKLLLDERRNYKICFGYTLVLYIQYKSTYYITYMYTCIHFYVYPHKCIHNIMHKHAHKNLPNYKNFEFINVHMLRVFN